MRLKELRIQNNYTQEELSQKLGITQYTYSNYEIGKTEPKIEIIKKIADFYNIDTDYLIERKNPNDLGHITKEQVDLFKMIKQLSLPNFYVVQGYVLRLLQEQV